MRFYYYYYRLIRHRHTFFLNAFIIVLRESRVLIAYIGGVPLQTGYVFTLHELI